MALPALRQLPANFVGYRSVRLLQRNDRDYGSRYAAVTMKPLKTEYAKQTGDTPSGLIFKSMIGTAMVIAVPPAVVWLLFALVRWFVL